jgi:hypothetical protein
VNARAQKKQLLVALPKEFGFKEFFDRSINSVAHDFSDFEVTIIPDSRGVSQSYFDSRSISTTTVHVPNSKLGCLSLLKKYTHVVIFWDGEELTNFVYFSKLLNIPNRIFPVQITKVCNKDKGDSFDIYIGRGSPWGNPFPIDHHEDGAKRKDVIDKYKKYFQDEFVSNPEKLGAILSLRGKRLACHCKPLDCHGDVIAEFLNSYEDSESK